MRLLAPRILSGIAGSPCLSRSESLMVSRRNLIDLALVDKYCQACLQSGKVRLICLMIMSSAGTWCGGPGLVTVVVEAELLLDVDIS